MNLKPLLFFLLIFLSCDPPATQEEEMALLDQQLTDILQLANSVDCLDEADWTFTAIGSKACGGPTGYIAYSRKINIAVFLDKVEMYTTAQRNFNRKWGVISDCALAPVPDHVTCVNGQPVLVD